MRTSPEDVKGEMTRRRGLTRDKACRCTKAKPGSGHNVFRLWKAQARVVLPPSFPSHNNLTDPFYHFLLAETGQPIDLKQTMLEAQLVYHHARPKRRHIFA